tara:strand:+ start:210 stop:614 length:405 start_codon:yes stop_codon:yes gene_type:complete
MSKTIKLSTTRKGYIGELLVIKFLLKKKLKVYAPVVDDFHIDLLVEQKGVFTKIQVKYHAVMMSDTSLQVKVTKTQADWIATPVDVGGKIHIVWYRNDRKDKRYTITFAIYKPKNNQIKRVNFYQSFLKSPFDN